MHATLASERLGSKHYFVLIRHFSSINCSTAIAEYVVVKFNFLLKRKNQGFESASFIPTSENHSPTLLLTFLELAHCQALGEFVRAPVVHATRTTASEFSFFADHQELLLRFKVLLALGVTTYVPYLKETKQNKASKILVTTMFHCFLWNG